MCLGVPGKVIEIENLGDGFLRGKVDFSGIVREVDLSFTPDVKVGEYVIVHVGFAIAKLDEDEARETLEYLKEISQYEEQTD